VTIYASGVGSAVLAAATADANGSFTATAHAPQSDYSPRLFLGVGQTSQKLGAANFQMQPFLLLTPGSGTVGSIVVAEGHGLGSLEKVSVYWNNPRTLLGTGAMRSLSSIPAEWPLALRISAVAAGQP
jgi:hypothetical protein